LNPQLIAELARYCAFRSRAFPASHGDQAALEEMLRFNAAQCLQRELRTLPRLELHARVIPDGRMQPHEWRFDARGRLHKTDGHSHGDDHLLPGPTDVCWDLAGAICEWQMNPQAAVQLVSEFERLTGDRGAQRRLPAYLLAYSALRCGELACAAHSCDAAERLRLLAAERVQRERLARLAAARAA
jgi:hypothetical protein